MTFAPPLGLYIHIPWCVRKCPYCDFNSHAAGPSIPETEYVLALLADLERDLPQVSGRSVDTVFIGGGTPSLFDASAIAGLLESIALKLALTHDAEITLEANPGTAESTKFRDFRAAGVNRLSIGVQSFNPRHLCSLGRIHDGEDAFRAAEMATAAGFDNFNLDLMFGLPQQTPQEALEDIRCAIDLKPTHLSFYQLTLEANTVFYRSPPPLPMDEAVWDMQQECQSEMAAAGYLQYEVSAYAQALRRCRHNLNYWRFGDYLGIGAGAHGKLTDPDTGSITRTWKVKHPRLYLETAGKPASLGGANIIPTDELPVEFLMNHLRLREGFTLSDFSTRTRLPAAELEPGLTRCLGRDLLEREGELVRCTDKGWNFLDNVLEEFLNPTV